ncbi:flagellin [Paenibacillus sp. 19GGS1-52]|uniref:flagellin N-terminal helical domain-containing protein n=1 Tax=Paenibacillus sp. 19GGS1-52 TaxID=2758563 RepID=UPI001EFC2DB2|nr:flagellin [Paenibacillus sp. 19GGS1-52]ULO07952.1 flagellin [Paenibacillus sp. 19GGS1-52]
MIINHNMGSINANRNMNINAGNASKSMEKLSSGLRINKAGDDAAGLAISEKMRGQIRGLDQASSNSQDAISLLQTGEGALNETTSILQRMRELAVQGSNDTLNSNDRGQVQKELDQLTSEIDRIGNNTEFNTKKLLNGGANVTGTSSAPANAVITGGTGDTVVGGATVAITASVLATKATDTRTAAFTAGVTASTDADMTINGTQFKFAAGTTAADTIKTINDAGLGVKASISGNDLVLTSTAAGSASKFTSDAATAGTQVPQAGTDAVVTGAGSYTAQGNTVTITAGANKGLQFEVKGTGATNLDVTGNGTLNFQIGANENQMMNVGIADMRATALGVQGIQVTDSATATTAITTIQTAIDAVSSERSKLGAYTNRLEHTIANLGTASENMTSAESRIRDVDMAKEMSTFSKNNILSQAAQAMLAQANQQPQQVLQLLR